MGVPQVTSLYVLFAVLSRFSQKISVIVLHGTVLGQAQFQKRKTDIGKKRMPVFLTSDFEQARLFLQRCIGRGKRSLVIRFRPDFGNKFYVTNRIRFIHDEDRSRGKSFERAVRDMSAVRF